MQSNASAIEGMNVLPTHEMLLRWQLASDYLNDIEVSDTVGTAALKTLVDCDVPLLFLALRNYRMAGWGECAPRSAAAVG